MQVSLTFTCITSFSRTKWAVRPAPPYEHWWGRVNCSNIFIVIHQLINFSCSVWCLFVHLMGLAEWFCFPIYQMSPGSITSLFSASSKLQNVLKQIWNIMQIEPLTFYVSNLCLAFLHFRSAHFSNFVAFLELH